MYWVQQQLVRLDTPSRHMLNLPVIGPLTDLKLDSRSQIQAELSAAAQRPELLSLKGRLQASPVPSDLVQLANLIDRLQKDSRPGLQSDFLSALKWRLQRIR